MVFINGVPMRARKRKSRQINIADGVLSGNANLPTSHCRFADIQNLKSVVFPRQYAIFSDIKNSLDTVGNVSIVAHAGTATLAAFPYGRSIPAFTAGIVSIWKKKECWIRRKTKKL